MKQEHKDYLEEHIANWHTVENGYVRNLDIQLLNMYEHIYRQYLDPQFVLTKWCSSCVMDMVQGITQGMMQGELRLLAGTFTDTVLDRNQDLSPGTPQQSSKE